MLLPDLRQMVLECAQRASRAGLVAATSGNYSSVDRKSGLFAITPTNYDYDLMKVEDVVVLDLDGRVAEGRLKPSSEYQMHALIYRRRADVGAVVHTHSPYATAFAALGREIPAVLIEIAVAAGGSIPVAPFELPGTEALGRSALDHIGDRKAVLLANHGVLALGADLSEALNIALWVEDTARIAHLAMAIGVPKNLPSELVRRLRASAQSGSK